MQSRGMPEWRKDAGPIGGGVMLGRHLNKAVSTFCTLYIQYERLLCAMLVRGGKGDQRLYWESGKRPTDGSAGSVKINSVSRWCMSWGGALRKRWTIHSQATRRAVIHWFYWCACSLTWIVQRFLGDQFCLAALNGSRFKSPWICRWILALLSSNGGYKYQKLYC